MTAKALQLLSEFATLTPTDQHAVAVQILRVTSEDCDVTEAYLDELADDLFSAYDTEEAANASS